MPAKEINAAKGLEDRGVFVLGGGLCDGGVELVDGADENLDELRQALGVHGQRLDEGLVAGEIDRRSDVLHEFVAAVFAADAVLLKERLSWSSLRTGL